MWALPFVRLVVRWIISVFSRSRQSQQAYTIWVLQYTAEQSEKVVCPRLSFTQYAFCWNDGRSLFSSISQAWINRSIPSNETNRQHTQCRNGCPLSSTADNDRLMIT